MTLIPAHATGVTHARTTPSPSTTTRHSWQTPIPQYRPRGEPPGLSRNATRPAAISAAPMLCPASARDRLAVDEDLDHVAASSTGANRSGEYHSSGSGLVAPVAQAATNSPVAGANPMPAPSWPVATQMFGASANGPMIGT